MTTQPNTAELIDAAEANIHLIEVGTREFELLNFAESSFWLRALALVNDHGLPQGISEELTAWANAVFRLQEQTKLAGHLRKGRISRSASMQRNRDQGASETLIDLRNAHLLLEVYQAEGIDLEMPSAALSLEAIIRFEP